MAKYIKSIFTVEKRRNVYEDELEGEVGAPPLDDRRKLSMSRSGRLKQSYKRRQQLCVEVYAGEDLHAAERPKSMEYHVHKPATTTITKEANADSHINSIETKIEPTDVKIDSETKVSESPSPEEEIDSAFEIIDKS